jgi:hypothetical protein
VVIKTVSEEFGKLAFLRCVHISFVYIKKQAIPVTGREGP